jgi:hypothetical protein
LWKNGLTESCIFQHEEEKVVYDRSNATKVRDWWKKLNVATKALVELADFRPMVENLAGSWSLKCVVLCLSQRWWDTTHTFHIACREMAMTPSCHRPECEWSYYPFS